jgi:hypothetical protein
MPRTDYAVQDEPVVDGDALILNLQNYDTVNFNQIEIGGREALYAQVAVARTITFTRFFGGATQTRAHSLVLTNPIKRFGPFVPSWGKQGGGDETLRRKLLVTITTAPAAADVKIAVVRERRPTKGA